MDVSAQADQPVGAFSAGTGGGSRACGAPVSEALTNPDLLPQVEVGAPR